MDMQTCVQQDRGIPVGFPNIFPNIPPTSLCDRRGTIAQTNNTARIIESIDQSGRLDSDEMFSTHTHTYMIPCRFI